MGTFYDAVLKMRKNGKSLIKKETPVKVKTKVKTEKPKETAVKKNDKGTSRKA